MKLIASIGKRFEQKINAPVVSQQPPDIEPKAVIQKAKRRKTNSGSKGQKGTIAYDGFPIYLM